MSGQPVASLARRAIPYIDCAVTGSGGHPGPVRRQDRIAHPVVEVGFLDIERLPRLKVIQRNDRNEMIGATRRALQHAIRQPAVVA